MRKPKRKNYAYDARIALWPNRDPIEEQGGANFYAMVRNDPVNRWELMGLAVNGQDANIELDKNYPTNDEYTYSYDGGKKVCGWSTDGKLMLAAGSDMTVASVKAYPTLESSTALDSSVKAKIDSGDELLKVTTRRPIYVGRASGLTERFTGFPISPLVFFYVARYQSTITDQSRNPLAEVPVGELVRATIQRSVFRGGGVALSSAVTALDGTVFDTYAVTFWNSSGLYSSVQAIFIGNWDG